MKKLQIEKLLTGVIKDFVSTINDENIKNIIIEKGYITGGCIPSMITDQWVNDYDIYFKDKESAENIKQYFTDNKESYNKNRDKYKCKLITDNAINLDNKIQLITKWYGSPEQVTNNFDWAHIKSWYNCNSKLIVMCNDVYQLLVEKELKYTGSQYPLSSLFRLKKYLAKGWTISNNDILRIVLDIMNILSKRKETKQEFMTDFPHEIEFEESEFDEELLVEKDTSIIEEYNFLIDKETLIEQMNGVDPITIQNRIWDQLGETVSIAEIIGVLNL